MSRNREEHMAFCKSRAKEIAATGDFAGAYASMVSDLNKHEETADHSAIELGMMLLMAGHLSSVNEMSNFIDGFN